MKTNAFELVREFFKVKSISVFDSLMQYLRLFWQITILQLHDVMMFFNLRVTKLYFATTLLCYALVTPRSNCTRRHEMLKHSYFPSLLQTNAIPENIISRSNVSRVPVYLNRSRTRLICLVGVGTPNQLSVLIQSNSFGIVQFITLYPMDEYKWIYRRTRHSCIAPTYRRLLELTGE